MSSGSTKRLQLLGNFGSTQPNWNQNDPTQPDYIHNRPFYADSESMEVCNGTYTFEGDIDLDMYMSPIDVSEEISNDAELADSIFNGDMYSTVIFDGVSYADLPVKPLFTDDIQFVYIGNLSLVNTVFGLQADDTGEPFLGLFLKGFVMLTNQAGEHTIALTVSIDNNIKKIPAKFITQTPSNWNQNDPTQPDYIKNRPFYINRGTLYNVVPMSTVTTENIGGLYGFTCSIQSLVGVTISGTPCVYVTFDGVEYDCVALADNGDITAGNMSIIDNSYSDTGEPFAIIINAGATEVIIVTVDTESTEHTVSIFVYDQGAAKIVKIPSMYLPDNIGGGLTEDQVKALIDDALGVIENGSY